MPYFAQEPLSYLTLPTIKNAYKSFSIKINFRPDNVDGEEDRWIILRVSSCWISVLLCVQYLSYFLMFLMCVFCPSPSLAHLLLTPSRWEGLILYAGESQSLRTTGTQVWCWLLWLHRTCAYCIQLRAVKETVHGLCFLTGFFFIMVTNALLGHHHHNKSPDINLFYIPMPFINELLHCWIYFMAVSLCKRSHGSKNNYYCKCSNYIQSIFALFPLHPSNPQATCVHQSHIDFEHTLPSF